VQLFGFFCFYLIFCGWCGMRGWCILWVRADVYDAVQSEKTPFSSSDKIILPFESADPKALPLPLTPSLHFLSLKSPMPKHPPLAPPSPTSNRQLRSSIPPTLINTLLHPLPTPLKEKIQRTRKRLIGPQPHRARRDLRAGRRILRLGPADRHGGAPAAGGTGGGLDGGDGEGGCLVGEPALGVGDGGVGGEDEGGEGGVWVVEVRKG